MIQLDNLTPEQVDMLDIMWALDTYEEYSAWLETLSEEDRRMADTLTKMIILEEMDTLLGECEEAKEVLGKFAL